MKITKLTDDSSWLIESAAYALFIDPWFTDSQVDGHPLFSLQKRSQTYGPFQIPADKRPILFVSHSFSDHCHKDTLLTFPKNTLVIAASRALKKIQAWKHFDAVEPISAAPFPLTHLTKVNLFNQTHHAFVLELEGQSLLYAPHGIRKTQELPNVTVLITTLTTYKLPFFLGGTVNLGLKAALHALERTGAKIGIATHDQQKQSLGLVGWFAKPHYAAEVASFRQLNAGESLLLT